jgi:hypothetical protein
MSVTRAKDEIDPWEFLGWLEYWKLEPFGPEADDMRAAQIAAAALNGPGMMKKPVSAEKFLLGKRPNKKQTVEEMQQIVGLWSNS